jgi:phosphoglycerate dehydrogenase-like enzyme
MPLTKDALGLAQKPRGLMKPRRRQIAILAKNGEQFVDRLIARFSDVEFLLCKSYQDLPGVLDEAQPEIVFAFIAGKPFPREALLRCASIRWLALASAGVEHMVPWDDDRLVVTNCAGVADEEMAQYAVASIFGLFQQFPRYARLQSRRVWAPTPVRSAKNAVIGVVGLGRTGLAVAGYCRALGLRVYACRSTATPSADVDRVFATSDLHAMLSMVDATVICAALTPSTRDMFDAPAFASMRKGSYLINISRGAVVVEEALIDALQSEQLGGAVIDVARQEPLSETSPLWDAPNLLITPHVSSIHDGWEAKAAGMFADNLERWLCDEPLEYRVYSARGY